MGGSKTLAVGNTRQPQRIKAEQALLGTLLYIETARPPQNRAQTLRPDQSGAPSSAKLFEAARDLNSQWGAADTIVLRRRFESNQAFGELGRMTGVAELNAYDLICDVEGGR